MDAPHNAVFAAVDLLHSFLDLKGLVPDLSEWTEESLGWNPPRLIRLRRLKSLFRAFGIAWNPIEFENGKHVRREGVECRQLVARAENYHINRDDLNVWHLPAVFCFLFRFRKDLSAALGHRLEEGFGYFIPVSGLIAETQGTIVGSVSSIDEVLADLIDPEKRSFSLDQLTRKYGYPLENLREIDGDFY